jgi:virulence factor Mce-like protein
MRRRGGAASIAGNPVLIGAATTLVVIVAVFLAYNANSGLPFVPTYDFKVEVPNAAGLVTGNDVRLGGTRIGTVAKITPETRPNGAIIAVLDLKLETSVQPIPADTQVAVRPRSPLGLKYVQLTRGTSERDLEQNGTLPLRQATQPVELDEFFNMFSAKARRAIQGNLTAYGNGFAGRGADLNFAVRDLDPWLTELTPLLRNLASEETDLRGFWDGLAQSAEAVVPVAETQGEMWSNLNTTFQALSEVAVPYIQESIDEGPETLETAIRDLPQIATFLGNSANFFTDLQPGVDALANAAPDLATMVRVGTPVLERTPDFNRRLATTFDAIEDFSTDPLVKLGINDLTATSTILNPTVAYITPAQNVCNYFGTLFRNLQSALSEGGNTGTLLRFSVIASPGSVNFAPNYEGGPSDRPANGPVGPGFDPSNFLHTNPYPLTGSPGQPRTCEAGNEPFNKGATRIGNVPGMTPTTLHDNTRTSTTSTTSGGGG